MPNASCILAFVSNIHLENLKPLSANPTIWSNTLEQFVDNYKSTTIAHQLSYVLF